MKQRLASLACVLFFSLYTSAQWMPQSDIPAYHIGPPPKGEALGKLIPPDQVQASVGTKWEPMQRHAFALAAKIPKVIYQEPCYCRCDKAMGHTSLHSCYEGQHAAICEACLKELYYTYLMTTREKKTPDQIRQGIVAGEWKSIDLDTAASID